MLVAIALKFVMAVSSPQVSDMAFDFSTAQREAQPQAASTFDFDTATIEQPQAVDFASLTRVGAEVDVEQTIRDSAKASGIDPITLLSIAQVESALDPKAKNPRSSAGGLFQFIDDTWNEVAGEGLDKFDAKANAEAGAEFTKRNIAGLKDSLDRDPTLDEIYMAHFLGLAGARSALEAMEANPDALATDVFSKGVIKANPNVFKEGVTARDAMKGLTDKVVKAAKQFK